jgi:hypothetical protein
MCARNSRSLKSKHPSIFSARRVSRYLGRDVIADRPILWLAGSVYGAVDLTVL